VKNLLKKLSEQAIKFENHNFSDDEVKNKFIGRLSATDEAISATEKRLGVKLPNDIKEFYKISNGTAIILNQTFGAFEPIEKIDWLKNADAYLIECYAEMGEDHTNDLKNSIIIAGINYCHNVLIIQPYGKHKKWRYWEFASYVPGETPFRSIKKYLERLLDFMTDQNKSKAETEK
jgi:SMI1 / KNR4 family (SUKH-1)